MGWIGVDLDGTLATYHGWISEDHIGEPIPAMVARVKVHLEAGEEVRIFTARVSPVSLAVNGIDRRVVVTRIQAWCIEHLGTALEVTHEKDLGMIQLYDDRCLQVRTNRGEVVEEVAAQLQQSLVGQIQALQKALERQRAKIADLEGRIANALL